MFEGFASIANGRYRVVLEESWYHERSEIRSPERRWYEQIPCKGGAFICLYSENPTTLKLFTSRVKNARIIFEQIEDRPKVRADFHFDGEAEIFFPPELLHIVAEMAGARKKRRLSPEARARLAERGKAYRFKGKKHGVEDAKTAQI
jgi:hypothetical protein